MLAERREQAQRIGAHLVALDIWLMDGVFNDLVTGATGVSQAAGRSGARPLIDYGSESPKFWGTLGDKYPFGTVQGGQSCRSGQTQQE